MHPWVRDPPNSYGILDLGDTSLENIYIWCISFLSCLLQEECWTQNQYFWAFEYLGDFKVSQNISKPALCVCGKLWLLGKKRRRRRKKKRLSMGENPGGDEGNIFSQFILEEMLNFIPLWEWTCNHNTSLQFDDRYNNVLPVFRVLRLFVLAFVFSFDLNSAPSRPVSKWEKV